MDNKNKKNLSKNPSDKWMDILNTQSYHIDDIGFEGLIFEDIKDVKHLSKDIVLNIYHLLVAAQKHAEMSFESLYELKKNYRTGIDKSYGKIINGKMIPAEGGLTSEEIAAVRYKQFIMKINCVLNPNPNFLKSINRMTLRDQLKRSDYAFEALSDASIILVDWFSNKPLVLDELTLKRMREGAKRGGYESAKTRRAQSNVPNCRVPDDYARS